MFGDKGVLHYGESRSTVSWRRFGKIIWIRCGRTAALEKELPPQYPFLQTITRQGQTGTAHLYSRRARTTWARWCRASFVSILSERRAEAAYKQGSGRLELAEAIASPKNPLTARVIVNRIWQHHFGQGLVRTPSNFGQLGDRPSHPELLDYLACRLIAKTGR